ncbi:MAG TPA: cytidylate kinase-like family protein [Solirubrobacteraceae bacterium]|jgi:cytidylate kinase|nr:cytidylate kinase-like family protein [Solirubrobacteraceae bacterium]
MPARVISISFSDGSGGEEVAVAVAAALGYPVVSEEILLKAAAEAGVSLETIADVERRKTFMSRLVSRLVPNSAAASDPTFRTSVDAQVTAGLIGIPFPLEQGPRLSQDELRGKIRSAIDEYMAYGEVVILAHAASHSLAGRDGVLRVFVTGSPQARSARLAASRLISSQDADKLVAIGDANRADYLKRFYGVEAESPVHYDIVVDTDALTVEDAVNAIVSASGSEQPV